MLKTFNRMKKRVGFLLYQFVLPALQVSLFCLAIGQDPKQIPVAVVNAESGGAACRSADVITECPVSLTGPSNSSRKYSNNAMVRHCWDQASVAQTKAASINDIRIIFGFFDPLLPSSAFGTDLYYQIHATSHTRSAFQ